MSPDLPDRLLGLSIDEPSEQRTDDGDDDEETYERFLFIYVGNHRLALPVTAVKAITDKPTELARIPRAAAPIAGITDLRGEITVVIDPHVHFPDAGRRAFEPSLLVLDRPSDQQPAAVIVDDVVGVETVPEDDVLDETAFSPDEIGGSALDHPLVRGIVKVERRTRPSVRETIAAESGAGDRGRDGPALTEAAATDRPATPAGFDRTGGPGAGSDDAEHVEVDEFSLAEAEEGATEDESTGTGQVETKIEVEATPLIDVDRLLLASGRATEGELDPQQ